jgi:hypothetical protein
MLETLSCLMDCRATAFPARHSIINSEIFAIAEKNKRHQ